MSEKHMATVHVLQDPTGIGREIHAEIIHPESVRGALSAWHDLAHFHPEHDESRRMAAVLAYVAEAAIAVVLDRRQREAARTGPWEEEDGYPGSLVRKRDAP